MKQLGLKSLVTTQEASVYNTTVSSHKRKWLKMYEETAMQIIIEIDEIDSFSAIAILGDSEEDQQSIRRIQVVETKEKEVLFDPMNIQG